MNVDLLPIPLLRTGKVQVRDFTLDEMLAYARANVAADRAQRQAEQERAYISPVRTVADLANNLLTMDQTLPIYGAQYIDHPTRGRCAIAVSPTLSRERVKDERWIGAGDDLNAAVVWTRAPQPATDKGAEIAALKADRDNWKEICVMYNTKYSEGTVEIAALRKELANAKKLIVDVYAMLPEQSIAARHAIDKGTGNWFVWGVDRSATTAIAQAVQP